MNCLIDILEPRRLMSAAPLVAPVPVDPGTSMAIAVVAQPRRAAKPANPASAVTPVVTPVTHGICGGGFGGVGGGFGGFGF